MGGGFGGFSFIKDKKAEEAKTEAVLKLAGWLEQLLPEEERWEGLAGGKAPNGKETNVACNQLACQEEDCPDVEVVCRLHYPKPRPRLMFKIYKPATDITHEELEEALRKAQAEQATEGEDGAEQAQVVDSEHHGDGCCNETHD